MSSTLPIHDASNTAPPPVTGSVEDPTLAQSAPQINTYHCICNQLLLATTYTLTSLPRRRSPGLDAALILPLPPPPHRSSSTSGSASSSASSSEDEADNPSEPLREPKTGDSRNAKISRAARSNSGYSLMLSTTLDRKPIIVRREDGFEKRWLWRCGRCKVVVGYQLDEVHFRTSESGGYGTGGAAQEKKRTREKVAYLLPGGLMTTSEMAQGKKMDDEIILPSG